MKRPSILRFLVIITLLAAFLSPAAGVRAAEPMAASASVSAFDLIVAMNSLRMGHGLPALVEDPIINAVAQSTAQTMAANQMSSHIGNVSGRLAGAGYGGGAKVWATENFAAGTNFSIDQIMLVWSDASHMLPAVVAAYCNVGAGVAKSSNGLTYYVLQAAYTASKSCGEYKSPGGTAVPGGGNNSGVSPWVVPVKLATPDADGKIYHVVQPGQSFWAIAIAYKITIKDLQAWNNLSPDSKLQPGQKLFIPSSNTAGYATPTPVGMIQVSTPGPDGKVVHVVQVYQTLSTISQAYGVKVETVLALNSLQVDWPLQIGQKLVIQPSNVTPTSTPRPLTPLEKLTPASDGKYYHIVKSGETLSYIANLYQIKLADLMSWNGLTTTSILTIGQKLLLQVTPPATITPTPGPPTSTVTLSPSATPAPPSATPTFTPLPTQTAISPTATVAKSAVPGVTPTAWIVIIGVALAGLVLLIFLTRRKK